MKKFLFIPLFIITLLVMLLLGHYNSEAVAVHWLVIKTQWPLSAIMAVMLFSGFVIGLFSALLISRKTRKVKSTEQQIKPQAQQQNENTESSTTAVAPLNPNPQG